MIKQSTKETLEKFTKELRKPVNSRIIMKLFALVFLGIFGMFFSLSVVSVGLKLVIESGVPESTIKMVVGVIVSTIGFTGFFWCFVNPLSTLCKIVFEQRGIYERKES
jgi:hypothetical protein